MQNIEQYIKDHRAAFNNGPLPNGHKERFLEKLHENGYIRTKKAPRHGSRIHIITRIILSVAAMFIIAFIIQDISGKKTACRYAKLMENEQVQVLALAEHVDPFTKRQMMRALENITFEAIPLSEQLPDELPAKEREQILGNYYRQKTEAIRQIKEVLLKEQVKN